MICFFFFLLSRLAPVLQPDEAAAQSSASSGGRSSSSQKLGEQWLRVRFSSAQRISGLRVWNYNKSEEDTYRGMRVVRVSALGVDKTLHILSPPSGFFLRKAPGNTDFDFGQTIHFQSEQARTIVDAIPPTIRKIQDYTMPLLPCGCQCSESRARQKMRRRRGHLL